MKFLINESNAWHGGIVVEAPEDITLGQLLKQFDRVYPDEDLGTRKLTDEYSSNVDFVVAYNDIKSVDGSYKIFNTVEQRDEYKAKWKAKWEAEREAERQKKRDEEEYHQYLNLIGYVQGDPMPTMEEAKQNMGYV